MRTPVAADLLLAVALVVLLIGPQSAAASDEKISDKWGYNVSLYGWLPSIDGSLKYNASGGGSSQEVDADSIIEDIQTVFMGNFEAHKSKWSFQADYIYVVTEKGLSCGCFPAPLLRRCRQ
jgi:hypothetical protein